ncbi:arginase family protein [Microbacterium lacus]|uniref:Arginase family protein n=1 Tax=Microbacterium lacus TaxID=415217 RepID=A0ABP4SBX5_9MICO
MARFVIVPQWQGSPSSRAMQLIDGAQAIAGDLPRSSCTTVEIPLEAGEAVETGVHRFSALRRSRELLELELAPIAEPVMLIGGDCGAAVGAVGHAAARHPQLAVIWLDAHPDLHTPDSSPSGAFSGMALRAVLGDGAEGLALRTGIPASRVVLAGARAYDPPEEEAVTALGVHTVDAAALTDADALAAAVAGTGADAVFIHVDLDVLDPAAMGGVTASVPFGVSLPDLIASIGRVRERWPLAGSSITGFAPPSPAAAVDDLGAILRIVGALA